MSFLMCRLPVNIFQFFVAVDYDTKDDRLWYEKYSIRKPMLPSFISMELGTKVSIAMYIKIMCTCMLQVKFKFRLNLFQPRLFFLT